MPSVPRKAPIEFESFFLKAPVALSVIDEDEEIVCSNERFHAEFGYAVGELPDIQSWWRLAYPDPEYRREVRRSWTEAVNRARASGSNVAEAEYRVRRRDGSSGTYIIGGALVGGYMVASFIDVSARKSAEEGLAEILERYRALTDTAITGIWQLDEEGRTIYFNSAMRSMLGLATGEEVAGIPFEHFFAPESRLRAEEEHLKRRRGLSSTYEARILDGQGGERDVIVTGIPILRREGGMKGIVATFVDISRLKEAEAQLRLLNAELESKVAERTDDLARANLELQAANRGLAQALEGIKEAQRRILVSEKLAALGRLMAGIYHGLSSPLSVIEAVSRTELRCLGSGLDELALAVSRLGPEELGFLREARERAVAEGCGPLRADPANERALKREVLSTLSEAGLRDPAPAANDLVELGLADMAEAAAPLLAGRAGEDLLALLRGAVGSYRAARAAEEAVGKASRVIAALRTYARGGEDESPAAFRLEPELRDILDLYGDRAKRGLRLTLEADRDLEAFGRREAMSRVWLNLIDNAVWAAGEDGAVEVAAFAEGGWIVVTVADSGPGIAPEIGERVFEPFFTTKPAGEATGLGLDIARRLAREEGGDIAFESRPGRTVFSVRLPGERPVEGGERR